MNTMNVDQALAEALGMDMPQTQALTPMIEVKPPVARPNANIDHISGDAEYARQNIYDVIEKGNEALFHIMELSKESAHPRAYEVLAQLLKTQAENVDKLLKVHMDVKKLNEVDGYDAPISPTSITNSNVVFMGTSNELVRLMRKEHITPKLIDIDDDTTTS